MEICSMPRIAICVFLAVCVVLTSSRSLGIEELLKKEFVSKSCPTPPSPTCVADVEGCLELMQISLTNPTPPDVDAICAGSESLLNCLTEVSKCSTILSSEGGDSGPSSPTEEVASGTTTGNPGSSSSFTLPTENIDLVCQFMTLENCPQTVQKCIELTDSDPKGLDVSDAFKCLDVIDQYSTASLKFLDSLIGGSTTTQESSSSTNPESTSPKTPESSTSTTRAVGRLTTPPSISSTTPASSSSITSTSSTSTTAAHITPTISSTSTTSADSSSTTSANRSSTTPASTSSSTAKANISSTSPVSITSTTTAEEVSSTTPDGTSLGPSEEQLALMCQTVSIPNCVEKSEKCFKLIGPGAPVPNTPSKEMVECSIFLSQFSGFGNTGGEGGSDATSGDSSTVTPLSTTSSHPSIPSKNDIPRMCQTVSIPNCVEKSEKCFELIGPGAPKPNAPSKELVECSLFLSQFLGFGDTDGSEGESAATPKDSSTVAPTSTASSQPSTPSKDDIKNMCTFMEVKNCTQRLERCFEIVGPDASVSGFPSQEMFECIDLIQISSDAALKFAESSGFGPGSFSSPLGLDSSTRTTPATTPTTTLASTSGPSREQLDLMCQTVTIQNCVEKAEKCFKLIGPGAPVPNTPSKEMIECSLFLSQFEGFSENSQGSQGGSTTPRGLDESSPSSTTPSEASRPSSESAPSKTDIENMCTFMEVQDCKQKLGRCFEIVGPEVPISGLPTQEMFECIDLIQQSSEAALKFAESTGFGPGSSPALASFSDSSSTGTSSS